MLQKAHVSSMSCRIAETFTYYYLGNFQADGAKT